MSSSNTCDIKRHDDSADILFEGLISGGGEMAA